MSLGFIFIKKPQLRTCKEEDHIFCRNPWSRLVALGLAFFSLCLLFCARGESFQDSSSSQKASRYLDTLKKVDIEEVKEKISSLTPQHQVEINLTNDMELMGYDISRAPEAITPLREENLARTQDTQVEGGLSPLLHQGDDFQIVFYWKALDSMTQDYSLLTILENRDQIKRTFQPLNGQYPTTQWKIGEVVRDPQSFSIPRECFTGDYRIKVGLVKETSAQPETFYLGSLRIGVKVFDGSEDLPLLEKAFAKNFYDLQKRVTLSGGDKISLTVPHEALKRCTGLGIISALSWAGSLKQGEEIAKIQVMDVNGVTDGFNIRVGIDTAEWSLAELGADMSKAGHDKAKIFATYPPSDKRFLRHSYYTQFSFDHPMELKDITLECSEDFGSKLHLYGLVLLSK